MTRKICVVTGSRADYGLLYRLLCALHRDPAVTLQTVATGAHLSVRHGLTVNAIKADGLPLAAKLPILKFGDSPRGITRSLAKAVDGFAGIFEKLKPDLLVVIGDRYEMLAASQAAMLALIPIAHIHGGESSEGAVDEAIRHAITKMAHFHFVSTRAYGRRIIAMGEDPARVFCFGAPGLDQIALTAFPPAEELGRDLGIDLNRRPFLLATYHPVTLDKAGPQKALKALFAALDGVRGATIVLTTSNADSGGAEIDRAVRAYAAARPGRVHVFASLGQKRYLGLMKRADVVVGNSSSGIFEAPAFKVPTVNVGDRQRGRLKDASVIDCAEDRAAIAAALKKALSAGFRRRIQGVKSIYGKGGGISKRIAGKLKTVRLDNVLMKKFYEPRLHHR